jgi:hypothetical protein
LDILYTGEKLTYYKINAEKFFTTIAIISLIVMGIKLLSVFYATSRGVSLGYPYDSLVFEQFHRFTDWLIPIEFSKLSNPFDTSNELYKHLPPAPYGILTFWILSLSKLIKPMPLFFIILFATLLINYLIFRKIIKCELRFINLIYFALLLSSYPLYFAIDRGNADIIAVLTISLFVFNILNSFNLKIGIILLTVLISLKPSWGLFVFCLIFFPINYIILSILTIFLLYTFPIMYSGAGYDYLLILIKMALPIIDNTNTFCHNFTCSLRVFNYNNQFSNFIIVILALAFNIFSLVKLKFFKPGYSVNLKIIISFFIALFTTLLINNPSPDYRLLILMPAIPLFIYIMDFYDLNLSRANYYLIILSYIFIFSFINISIVNFFPIHTFLRFSGVFLLFIIFNLILFRVSLDNSGK